MDPVTKAVLQSWNWRLDVIIVLALAGALYFRGWRRLRQRTHAAWRQYPQSRRGRWRLVAHWRLVAYGAGLLFIALALLSPIDILAHQLFFMHMIQHLLLIMFAPPLLLIANPMPFLLWGLPDGFRFRFGHFLSWLLRKDAPFRRGLLTITNPGFVWLLWVITLIGWHDPFLYNAALRHSLIHDLEHWSFFGVSMLFWWNITGAGPRVQRRFTLLARTAIVLAAIPPNMLLGVFLAFAREPIYTYYLAVPRLWGIDVMSDQQLGGVIMWVPGSMMYLIAGLLLIARILQGEIQKPALPESAWATDENMAAPSLEK